MDITVKTTIKAPIEKVWEFWTKPAHIVHWNFASSEWICPSAINDLQPNGAFNWRMEAKDGSMGFDFTGVYSEVKENESIAYKMSDGRKVEIEFLASGNEVELLETFEGEGTNADEQQRLGWQAILDNFKNYVESKG